MKILRTWMLILFIFIAYEAKSQIETGIPLDRPYELDHRFLPEEWQSAICLPDDWQKTLIDKSGQLLYDWPYENGGFATKIDFGFVEGKSNWIKQNLDNPRIPIVKTLRRFGDLEIISQSFAVTDQKVHKLNELQEIDSEEGIIPLSTHEYLADFAKPTNKVDVEFSSVDIGRGTQLFYKYKTRKTNVVLGFCEGVWDEEGQRVFEIHIDGIKQKTVDLVKEGGKDVPFVVPVEAIDTDGDGFIEIKIKMAQGAKDTTTILNALWIFDKLPPTRDIIEGKANRIAKAILHSGAPIAPNHTGPARADMMLVTIRNIGKEKVVATPTIDINTDHIVTFDSEKKELNIRNWRNVNVWPEPSSMDTNGKDNIFTFPQVMLTPDESKEYVISIHSNAEGFVWTSDEAKKALENAKLFWSNLDLPYNVIEIPDEEMQAQFDGALRNIYQAREIKNGLPSFQVGPTMYRGLWIVDGSFILEAITMLNRAEETRAGVEHMLSFQRPDGSFEKLNKYWKENGIVLWTIDRHEQLTGDSEWLDSVWPVVEKTMAFIPILRERSRIDTESLSYDFIPYGYSDGGLNQDHEYTNAYWILIGIKSAISMAQRSGREEQAKRWQLEYDSLWQRFLTLAKRDLYTDEFGNKMLPVPMTRPLKSPPHKAQWAFMHAIYPGELFQKDDQIMLGTMANLTENECEGQVINTGWDEEGMWGYFTSFYGHAFLWLGEGKKAAQCAYAFGNHSSPLYVWREEQRVKNHPNPHWFGDMPHNWASAEFIRLVLHMVVLERGNELHLLEGVPKPWFEPGKQLAINEALTSFGEVSLKLRISDDGKYATMSVIPPKRIVPEKILVHFNGRIYDLFKSGEKKNDEIVLKQQLFE
jgi:hypothetical protein